jgi:hypothetical protein
MASTNIAKLIILNTCWAALVVWASVMGYAGFVFTHDISGLSYVISAVLAATVLSAFVDHKRILPHAKIWVVMLGLIGNLIGFVIALHGMAGGDLTSAAGLLTIGKSLIDGLSVAFCSTLVGAIASLWIGTNSYVLHMEASE